MRWILPCLILSSGLQARPEVKHLVLAPTSEMERAELYMWVPNQKIKAVMVFCPGHNGSGESFAKSSLWQNFAIENDLALCGLSFASPMSVTEEGKGYSYADRGSGMLLLNALSKEVPEAAHSLYLYGYSAGARFTTSLLAWRPQTVAGWCASGVGIWPPLPPASPRPAAGIVACGEFDAGCYWSSLHYFQLGREKGYPWCWVSLKDLGHASSSVLDRFVMNYFALRTKSSHQANNSSEAEVYYDIVTKRRLDSATANSSPIFAAGLPADTDIVNQWLRIHYP